MVCSDVAYFIHTELGLGKANIIVYMGGTKGHFIEYFTTVRTIPAINESDEVGNRVRAGANGGRFTKNSVYYNLHKPAILPS